jgi:Bacteriophage tail sheath protein
MPVTTSYPGVYIEELPNLNHSVTPAPTSVTVFVGYTHPFKTKSFGVATEIFGFADYQANFGGFFDLDDWLPDYMGNAVNQFFQNGGTDAWVVGLQATGFVNAAGTPVDGDGNPTVDAQGNPVVDAQGNPLAQAELKPATIEFDMTGAGAAAGSGTVTLTAREPGGADPKDANNSTGSGTLTKIQILNRKQSDPAVKNFDIADVIITRGNRVETYRAMSAANIAQALGTVDNPVSQLVTVSIADGGTPASFPESASGPKGPNNELPVKGNLVYPALPPQSTAATLVNPTADYGAVFQDGASLDVDVKIFNLMLLPGISPVDAAQSAVLSDALSYCEKKRAFFIMDAPPNATTNAVGPQPTAQPLGTPAAVTMDNFWNGHTNQAAPPVSTNGAIYFPYLQTVNPVSGKPMTSPPSGFVAGIFAKEDLGWSVGKAPAGLETTLQGTTGVVPWGRMTDMQQGVLNKDGVNCLREFPGLGRPVVFGARTLVSSNTAYQQWKYVPVRRTALFLEQSLYGSLGWAVFQPNAQPLWDALAQTVEAFMLTLFRQGNYFQGTTPSEAFLVKCDSTTTTQADIDNGIVNILVGFAPLKPAEFVVIQIAQLAGQTQT